MSTVWSIKIVGRYYELLDIDDNSMHITADRNMANLLEYICKRHNAECQEISDAEEAAYKAGYTDGWNAAVEP